MAIEELARGSARDRRLLTALLGAAALASGCGDLIEALPLPIGAAAARPPGWESLDDESEARRLYYQFVDARGRVRFVERLEDVPEPWRANVGFVKMDSPPPVLPADAARLRGNRAQRGGSQIASSSPSGPEVVLYSAEWCGACRSAKHFLARRGVDYDERDIDDPAMAAELLRKTGRRGIPVLEVHGRIVAGFNASSYDVLLGGA